MATDERLTGWLREFSLNLTRLKLYEKPGEFELDYSDRYLTRLGEITSDDAEDPASSAGPDDPASGLAQAVAGYAGEVLLRLAGGGWRWSGDEPVVHPDEALGLPPVAPLRLVAQAVQDGDEEVFARAYAAWREAVARHQRAHPGWTPVKEHTPGVDPVPMTEGEREHLAAWLAGRERAYATWAAEHAADGPWDFSPESLDRLEGLLRRRTPTVETVKDPANAGFVDGAVWYLGETLLRGHSGTWVYRKVYPGSASAYQPYVRRDGHNRGFVVPFYVIRGLARGGDRGALRAKYEQWVR